MVFLLPSDLSASLDDKVGSLKKSVDTRDTVSFPYCDE
jgi:hypothetical protein